MERKLELLKIRKKLNDYTISVKYLEKIKTTILELNKISNLDGFRYISKNELERYYKIDSGLNFEEYTTII